MLQIAVIGTGSIGASHLDSINRSKDCELCAVCDVNEEVLKTYSEKYQVPGFTDYRDIVTKTKAEAVILNLPHFLHCDVTEFFLEHGMHVLVEKPMANTVEECDRMIRAAEQSSGKLAIGHVQRFLPGNVVVKEIYDSGELGELCMVTEFRTTDYFQPSRPKWFLDKKKAGGGITMNYGAHALDKFMYIMDSDPVDVTYVKGNIKNDATIEGHSQMLVKFDNGVSGTITFCGYAGSGYENVYYFTNGTLKVTNANGVVKNVGNGWEPVAVPQVNFLDLQLIEFIKYIKGEESTVVTPQYGRQVISLLEKVLAD